MAERMICGCCMQVIKVDVDAIVRTVLASTFPPLAPVQAVIKAGKPGSYFHVQCSRCVCALRVYLFGGDPRDN